MKELREKLSSEIKVGAAYYPEIMKDEKVIDDDILKMKTIGINVVRMGEFAWGTMEKEEGKFDFSFFRHVMDKLYDAEIGVIFCTPSPTPPKWLTNKYSEIYATNEDGSKKQFGARNDFCKSSPLYREKTGLIARNIAKELSNHPALIGWQIDNEISPHETCFCKYCKQGFSKFLEKRYTTIDNLNKEWGNARWSLEYKDFQDVIPPKKDMWSHPSLKLEWERFHSLNNAEFIHSQIKVIKEYSDLPIGTDMMPILDENYYEMNMETDVVQFNHYEPSDFLRHPSLWYDYIRSIKNKPFWVTETQVNWNGPHYPACGYRPKNNCYVNTWLAVAKGAETNMYWHWREHFAGHELYHGAVLTASGRFCFNAFEIKDAIDDFRKCKDLLMNNFVKSDIAIHFSTTAWLSYKYVWPYKDIDYLEQFYNNFHLALRHYNVDAIDTYNDISSYRVVISPYLSCVDEHGLKEKIIKFVEEGGTWIAGPLTDILKDSATRYTNAPFGFLEDFAGIYSEMQIPFDSDEIKAEWNNGEHLVTGRYHEGFSLKGAESLAKYTTSHLKGLSVITQKKVGKGKVIVIGSSISGKDVLKLMNIDPILKASDNVELVDRGKCIIAVEIENKEGNISLDEKYIDVLSNKEYIGEIKINPFSVMVLKKV